MRRRRSFTTHPLNESKSFQLQELRVYHGRRSYVMSKTPLGPAGKTAFLFCLVVWPHAVLHNTTSSAKRQILGRRQTRLSNPFLEGHLRCWFPRCAQGYDVVMDQALSRKLVPCEDFITMCLNSNVGLIMWVNFSKELKSIGGSYPPELVEKHGIRHQELLRGLVG